MAEPHSARLTAAEGRRFAFPVGAAFLLIASVFWWRRRDLPRDVAAFAGFALVAAGALIPTRLGPVYRGWMGFARVVSRITTPILMGLVYFAVITPIGIVRRNVARNPLVHRRTDGSYFVTRDPGRRQGDLRRQF